VVNAPVAAELASQFSEVPYLFVYQNGFILWKNNVVKTHVVVLVVAQKDIINIL